MAVQNIRFVKKMTSLIGVFGLSAAIISFSTLASSTTISFQTTVSPEVLGLINEDITQIPTDAGTTPGGRRPQTRLSELDRLYITESAQGGMAEVQMAKLALQRSKDNNVRQYANQMIQEHTPVNQQLMQLASQKGVRPPTTLGPKYQAAIARISQLSGSDFDQAYKNEAGINLHMEYFVVQRRQAELGQDADLKAFATKNIPVTQKHLQMGDRLLTPANQ